MARIAVVESDEVQIDSTCSVDIGDHIAVALHAEKHRGKQSNPMRLFIVLINENHSDT